MSVSSTSSANSASGQPRSSPADGLYYTAPAPDGVLSHPRLRPVRDRRRLRRGRLRAACGVPRGEGRHRRGQPGRRHRRDHGIADLEAANVRANAIVDRLVRFLFP